MNLKSLSHLLPPDRGNNGGVPGWCFRHQSGFIIGV